jgi:hypothetical protein
VKLMLPQQRTQTARLFFFLTALKIVRHVWHSYHSFQAWEAAGRFEYNAKSYFVFGSVKGLAYGLVPYIVFGLLAYRFARRLAVAVGTGVALLSADLLVSFIFRNSRDGQTGIAIAILYLILLLVILMGFLVANRRVTDQQNGD